MPKGVADGLLDLSNRGIAAMRSLAKRGDLYAEAIDELVTEFSGLVGGGPAALGTERVYHQPTITPNSKSNAPGQQPDLKTIGTLLVANYTVNTDVAYRMFKVPGHYVEGAAFHVHWTKEAGIGGDGNQSGNAVKWRISYTVFPGSGQDVNVAPTVLEVEDTYDDAGTTSRFMQRTPNLAASGFIANYYVGICVEAVTPTGAALTCEPALASVDLTFSEFINQ